MSGNELVDPNILCTVEEGPERYAYCIERCENASSRESNRDMCRWGCEFWDVPAGPRPTGSPTTGPTPSPSASYEGCIGRCTSAYGGDATSGKSYMCAKGCATMSGGLLVDPSLRYGYCLTRCAVASSHEANRAACRYGCDWWESDLSVGLRIKVDSPALSTDRGEDIVVDNYQISYDSSFQDTTPIHHHMLELSDGGSTITASGNAWRAFPLPSSISPSDLGDFILSFDFQVIEAGEAHGICFEDNLTYGDADDPRDNGSDPRRCIFTAFFQKIDLPDQAIFTQHQTPAGGAHRYIVNLGKLYDRLDEYSEFKYVVFVSDNDVGDKTGGEVVWSNITLTTRLTSCLADQDFSITLSDCTAQNVLAEVKTLLEDPARGCANTDPLMELFALFDATDEMDVYNMVSGICSSGYGLQYDFAGNLADRTELGTHRQLVGEFLDGGATWNYERDSDGTILAEDTLNIVEVSEQFAASSLLAMPEHHALDHCDIGAVVCCTVDNRKTAPSSNADVCYVDMKASRRSAHVRNGWSIYGGADDRAYCHGFAWGTDEGSIATALKGNALFKVAFLDGLRARGNVEQVPGSSICGCVDRMPVVTDAACTSVSADSSVVTLTYKSTLGKFKKALNLGPITYGDCDGMKLREYYSTLQDQGKASGEEVAYVNERLVGDGGCSSAIGDFLSTKGLMFAGRAPNS